MEATVAVYTIRHAQAAGFAKLDRLKLSVADLSIIDGSGYYTFSSSILCFSLNMVTLVHTK